MGIKDLSNQFTNLAQVAPVLTNANITASFSKFGGRKINLKTDDKEFTFKMYQLLDFIASLAEKSLQNTEGDKKAAASEAKAVLKKAVDLNAELKKSERFPNIFVKFLTLVRRFFGHILHNPNGEINRVSAELDKVALSQDSKETPKSPVTATPDSSKKDSAPEKPKSKESVPNAPIATPVAEAEKNEQDNQAKENAPSKSSDSTEEAEPADSQQEAGGIAEDFLKDLDETIVHLENQAQAKEQQAAEAAEKANRDAEAAAQAQAKEQQAPEAQGKPNSQDETKNEEE